VISHANSPIRDEQGNQVGLLTLAQLPGREAPLGVGEAGRPVVTEGAIYRFEVEIPTAHATTLEPGDELFSFDDETGLSGRMQPKQHVGRIRIQVTNDGANRIGWTEIDVRPTKLDAETEYREMLEDVADIATDAVLQGFAPASLAMAVDPETRPQLLYQQFALLHARLSSPELRDALARVLHDPHVAWTDRRELQPAGRPVPGSSALDRAVMRPGPRVQTRGRLAASSIPRTLERRRTDPSIDSVPNRFVKYALQRWRSVAQELAEVLGPLETTGPVRRGIDATNQVLRQLNGYLSAPLFREVGELAVFPGSNQVLQKRHGYRQVLRTFVLGEVGAQISFDWELDDVFSADQRNVATLYEYWCFLQLAEAVGIACGEPKTAGALVATSDNLSLGFAQGQRSALEWKIAKAGRELDVQLFFNRTFLASASPSRESSWTRGMRPDASIRVQPRSHLPDLETNSDLDLWLHFDAKYRLDDAGVQFTREPDADARASRDAERQERVASTKRQDLLKMHAYRDAIRRSAGAYVLYPGTDKSPPFREHAEVLPGLGAFVLRPAAGPMVDGRDDLVSFLEAVLEHAAERASQHERDRYWRGRIYARSPESAKPSSRLPELDAPPRDTPVLCGFVRNERHAKWIRETELYNVRAGDRRGAMGTDASELQADWLLLYGSDGIQGLYERRGAWFVQTRGQLLELRYPRPRGSVYLCAPVAERNDAPGWLREFDVTRLAAGPDRARGAPFAVTWADLAEGRPSVP
jgi:predicted component of viral defense system (DUF524 family)